MPSSASHVRRARLSLSISAALLGPMSPVLAGTLVGQPHTVAAGDPKESWVLSESARLTLSPGALSDSIQSIESSVTIDGGSVSSAGAALAMRNGSTANITNGASIVSASGAGLSVTNAQGDVGEGVVSTVNVADSSVVGATSAVLLGGGAQFAAVRSSISATGTAGIGINLFNADVAVQDKSTVSGQLHGIRIDRDDRGETTLPTSRHVLIDDSQVTGVAGSGIVIDTPNTLSAPVTDVTIDVRNGSEIIGGSGIAIDMANRTSADILVDNSHLDGDIRVASGGAARISLANAAVLDGAMNGDIGATVASGSTWNVTGASSVSSLVVDGGALAFQPTADGSHIATQVRGDFAGSGGTITLNTALNEGGALSNQATDRLLIEGNVTTTGPTELIVKPTGAGALTDANQNGVVESGEGISLVQVAGSSRANAFTLRGGYVAAGPWQYTLHAFGPGETDPAQSALAAGSLNWDYRLGNRYVCQTNCDPVDPTKPVDPGDPGDPGNPGDPENPVDPVVPPTNGRVAVVPQLPSYLSAPAALLTYGDMMNDGLHQRLGDLRTGSSHDPLGGEVFARYLGGQMRYSSNLSFQKYGYDFDQQVNALQVGGSLIALDGDNGTLRAGWAADHGTTRVTPKAADGNSSAKYNANGMSAWMTWQQGNGLWVDGVLGSTRYQGDVGTDLRGGDVGRVHANGWTMSVEVGKPFALGNEWTIEPRFQLKHQSLNFRDFTDGDGLDVRLGTAKQTSSTVGARIMRSANPVFMPYANLDLTHTSNGDPNADVSNADWDVSERFGSGRVGNSYRVAAGAVSQLGEHVQVYGEGTYQHFVGSYGMQGWAGNVGIRVTF
jgi:outer membrane autotransporter protein